MTSKVRPARSDVDYIVYTNPYDAPGLHSSYTDWQTRRDPFLTNSTSWHSSPSSTASAMSSGFPPQGRTSGSVERTVRTTKKRISDEEWQVHKDNIERLYLDEGRDVREVRDTMKRDYGFEAHEKAYKRKFEEWGLIKNIPKEEGLFMVKKRERRRDEEGKETIFRRRRRPDGPLQLVLDDKVDRIADRYSHDLNNYPNLPLATPENIEYDTPNATPAHERVPRQELPHLPHLPHHPGSSQGWPFPPVQPHPDPFYVTDEHAAIMPPQHQPPNMPWDPWAPNQYY